MSRSIFLFLCLTATSAQATTILAFSNGSANPSTSIAPDPVQNGDFRIEGLFPNGTAVGDGRDERTIWTMTPTDPSAQAQFATEAEITTASLTLGIRFNEVVNGNNVLGLRTEDAVSIVVGGEPLRQTFLSELFPVLPSPFSVHFIAIDLLSFNTPEALIGLYRLNENRFTFQFQDDAVVFSAQLHMANDQATVAEPPPTWLILAGMCLIRWRMTRLQGHSGPRRVRYATDGVGPQPQQPVTWQCPRRGWSTFPRPDGLSQDPEPAK